MKISFYRWLLVCLVATTLFVSNIQAAEGVAPRDRILILISLDGFRYDYLQKFNPPNLNRLAAEGVRAKRLIPAFPSLTFPNHYTIVTGLWPEHHGIVNNSFYDPVFKTNFAISKNPGPREGRWWGGEPIWVTAVKQGRVADCMFWPGSEAEIKGVRPTEWKPYDNNAEPDACVDTALNWLAQTNQRPSLVTLYFHNVDSASHHDGVDSPAVVRAVAQVDEAVGRLMNGLDRLKLQDIANVIVVSDHGMTDLSTNRIVVLNDYVDLKKVQVDFSGALAGLRPLDGDVTALYKQFSGREKHFKAYRRDRLPARFHFDDNRRIPPVILVAEEGWYISRQGLKAGKEFEKATHGYDPKLKSMGAVFIARGAAFRHGVVLSSVENIGLYNLFCATLGLVPAPNDGDDNLVRKVLAQ